MSVFLAGPRGRRRPSPSDFVVPIAVCALMLLFCAPAFAQQPPVVTEVRVEQEGRTVTDPEILGLIGTTVGQPLSVQAVTESIQHLSSIGLDGAAEQEEVPGGLRGNYRLVARRQVGQVGLHGYVEI